MEQKDEIKFLSIRLDISQKQLDDLNDSISELMIAFMKLNLTIDADFNLLKHVCEKVDINPKDFLKESSDKKSGLPDNPTYLSDFGIEDK